MLFKKSGIAQIKNIIVLWCLRFGFADVFGHHRRREHDDDFALRVALRFAAKQLAKDGNFAQARHFILSRNLIAANQPANNQRLIVTDASVRLHAPGGNGGRRGECDFCQRINHSQILIGHCGRYGGINQHTDFSAIVANAWPHIEQNAGGNILERKRHPV